MLPLTPSFLPSLLTSLVTTVVLAREDFWTGRSWSAGGRE